MRILVLESDAPLRSQICSILQACDHEILDAQTREDALSLIPRVDLAVINPDPIFPAGREVKLDARDVRKLRGQGVKTMILIISAAARWTEIVEGLEAGADDYLTKPFHPAEFSARVSALSRRQR